MITFESLNPEEVGADEKFRYAHEHILIPAFAATRLEFNYHKMHDLFVHKACSNERGLKCQLHVVVARQNNKICGVSHWLSFDDLHCAFRLYTSVLPEARNQGISTKLSQAVYQDIDRYFKGSVPVYSEIRKQDEPKKTRLLKQLQLRELGFNYQFYNGDYLNKNWMLCLHGPNKVNKSDFFQALKTQAEFYAGHNFKAEEVANDNSLQAIHNELSRIPGDYIYSKPYISEMRDEFLPTEYIMGLAHASSVEEFELILAGKTRTKPKIISHPDTNETYRLAPCNPANEGYTDGHYAKIQLNEPSIVDCYMLSGEKLKSYASKQLPPLPEGYEIRSLKLQKDSTQPLKQDEITPRQLYELLTPIGVDSCWWPIEDPMYGAHEYFVKQNINVLFHDDYPVGVTMWDETELESKKTVMGSFLGILPKEKGKGLGGYLFEWGLQQIAKKGAERRLLVTSPQDVMSCREGQVTAPPAQEMYAKRGFEYLGSQLCHRQMFDPEQALAPLSELGHSITDHLSKHNAPAEFFMHPISGSRLLRYSETIMDQRRKNAFMQK